MHDKVIAQIRFEIGQIDQLFASYANLFHQVQTNQPDLVQIAAVASVLHSFYNGLENIFLSVAKGIDADVPAGAQWHRDLLSRMTRATPKRAFVITKQSADQLADYMAFRHFYRHSYSFLIEWDELEKLVTPLDQIWEQIKNDLATFFAGLK